MSARESRPWSGLWLRRLLQLSRGICDGERSVSDLLDALDLRIREDGLEAVCEPSFGDRARPRRFELAGALNRLRALCLVPRPS